MPPYDAILVLSFGGPEGHDDVMPFLRNVTRGRGIPDARLAAVAEHYHAFGGVSPINDQNRALVSALRAELLAHGPRLPVYWGNRNWHPMLAETLQRMVKDGVKRALVFATSAYSSYSGCRQYRQDIARAIEAVPGAPQIDKLRVFFNHPGFVGPNAALTRAALEQLPAERRGDAVIVFTAHSLPSAMARSCGYQAQLTETARLITERLDHPAHDLVFQSRSGPPHVPWLGPDVCDHLDALAARGVRDVVIAPIGFISDHMEVIHDLDVEAREKADALGINLVRSHSVGAHPRFIQMIRELITERIEGTAPLAIGRLPPRPHVCPVDCCPVARRPSA